MLTFFSPFCTCCMLLSSLFKSAFCCRENTNLFLFSHFPPAEQITTSPLCHHSDPASEDSWSGPTTHQGTHVQILYYATASPRMRITLLSYSRTIALSRCCAAVLTYYCGTNALWYHSIVLSYYHDSALMHLLHWTLFRQVVWRPHYRVKAFAVSLWIHSLVV